jgi:hypothetical protein
VTCFGTKAKRSEEVVRQEPRFAENSTFGHGTDMAGSFPLKRLHRGPVRMLQVYDPRARLES